MVFLKFSVTFTLQFSSLFCSSTRMLMKIKLFTTMNFKKSIPFWFTRFTNGNNIQLTSSTITITTINYIRGLFNPTFSPYTFIIKFIFLINATTTFTFYVYKLKTSNMSTLRGSLISFTKFIPIYSWYNINIITITGSMRSFFS